MLYDLVDKAIFHCLISSKEIISLGITLDNVKRLACILGQYLIKLLASVYHMVRVNLDIGALTGNSAARNKGLVDHYFRIGQSKSLALCTCGKEKCSH